MVFLQRKAIPHTDIKFFDEVKEHMNIGDPFRLLYTTLLQAFHNIFHEIVLRKMNYHWAETGLTYR